MEKLHGKKQHPQLWASLVSRCEACCGLCCTMLYFAKSEGFPEDKAAGTPCGHLQPDFRCRVHSELGEKKLKGCLAFDCLGAGQKVTQQVYGRPHMAGGKRLSSGNGAGLCACLAAAADIGLSLGGADTGGSPAAG